MFPHTQVALEAEFLQPCTWPPWFKEVWVPVLLALRVFHVLDDCRDACVPLGVGCPGWRARGPVERAERQVGLELQSDGATS